MPGGNSKGRKLSEAAKAALLKCYLHGARPSVSIAIKAAKRTLEKQGIPEHAEASTWRRWLKDYEKHNAGVICLAREGMKAYQQPHSDLDSPPADLFLAGRGPGVDTLQLNHDFLMRKEVCPRNCRVTLWGIDYESDCLHNLSRKEPILAMIDTANLDQICCYTKDGIYLGEAFPVQACHPMARRFGDQVALDQVIYQNKRQATLAKNTRKQLTALGVTKDAQDSLNILPFAGKRPKEPVLPAPEKKGPVPEALSEKEVKRIEAAVKKAEEAMDSQPKIKRPKYWLSDLAHYEWCFKCQYEHGQQLDPADVSFMKKFEGLPEFDQYRQHFEDLKTIYR